MKVAVASTDGVSISPHFGRSGCFIVFTVEDKKISGREVRKNDRTAFAKGECNGGNHHIEHHNHSHSDIVNLLTGCEAVICYGMGWRAAADLKTAGIQPYILDQERTPDEAVTSFLEGKLKSTDDFCRCHS